MKWDVHTKQRCWIGAVSATTNVIRLAPTLRGLILNAIALITAKRNSALNAARR